MFMSETKEIAGIVRSVGLHRNGLELTINTSGAQKRVIMLVSCVHNEFDLMPYSLALDGYHVTGSLCGLSTLTSLTVEEGPLSGKTYTSKKYGRS